jgi:Bacterial regulatory proteins, gntR family
MPDADAEVVDNESTCRANQRTLALTCQIFTISFIAHTRSLRDSGHGRACATLAEGLDPCGDGDRGDLAGWRVSPEREDVVAQVGAIELSLLRPGQRLPTVRQLAEFLGIDRNTVAQASRQLESEGHVITRAGGGTTVAGDPTTPTPPPAPALRYVPDEQVVYATTNLRVANGCVRGGTPTRPCGIPAQCRYPCEEASRLGVPVMLALRFDYHQPSATASSSRLTY